MSSSGSPAMAGDLLRDLIDDSKYVSGCFGELKLRNCLESSGIFIGLPRLSRENGQNITIQLIII